MKKGKRLIALMLGLGLALSSAACADAPEQYLGTGWTLETAYAKAQELGYEGSYAEFSANLQGVDGVGIESVSVNENGQLLVTLANGKELVCGKIDADGCAHEYQGGGTIESTCEKFGYEFSTCAHCGNVKYDLTPALGHDWQMIDYWEEPTEDDAGVGIFVCMNCYQWKVGVPTDGGSGGEDEPEIDVETKTMLYVTVQNMGYGTEWIRNLELMFEEIYKDVSFEEGKTGVDVVLNVNKESIIPGIVQSSVADLYFVYDSSVNMTDLLYCDLLEDITDAVTTPWNGESTTTLEKLPSGKAFAYDGRTYAIPYAETQYGITYNANIFEKYDLKVPNTTDELVKLCEELMMYGVTPFTSSGASIDFFWDNLPEIWWAQYEGVDAYERYWNGVNEQGEFTTENFAQTGRLKALQTFERLSGQDYHSQDSFNSSYSHLNAIQGYFMSEYDFSNGKIAMMPYLDCLYMEGESILMKMEAMYGPNAYPNIRMMKTPVISDIIEKCPSIPDDETLSAVINAIDQGLSSYTGVSDEDFRRVAEARGVTVNSNGMSAFVVKGRNKTQAAKEFLRFVTSDEAIAAVAQSGMKTVFNYEYTQEQLDAFDPVTRDVLTMRKEENNFTLPVKSSYLLYQNGLRSWQGSIAEVFRQTVQAERLFEETLAYYEGNFRQIYESAGLA